MTADGIKPEDMRMLQLMDLVMGRFEADAGFALPGLAACEIRPDMALKAGAGTVDEKRMRELAAIGLLVAVSAKEAGGRYVLSQSAERLLEQSGEPLAA